MDNSLSPGVRMKWRRALRWSAEGRSGQALLTVVCLWAAYRLVMTAWIGDDAFITFRVVDNFVNGYGLRWNIGERVQAYTNPLWMLLHIPFYAVWRNIFLITLILSFACTIASVAVVARTWPKSPVTIATALILPLALSRSWMEFSVSGLENPLSFLLFALFGRLYIAEKPDWLRLSLVVALAMLNRLDVGVLYLPPMLWLAWNERRNIRLRSLALGFLPLAAWLAFSLLYYGFLFPNTKYAKLNTGIDAVDYLKQGGWYTLDFLMFDASAAFVLALGILLFIRNARLYRRLGEEKHTRQGAIGLGMIAYCGYAALVGGDFMTGRFFTLPVFVAAWSLYEWVPKRMPAVSVAAALYLCALAQLSAHINTERKHCTNCFPYGIADERWVYQAGSALIRPWDMSLRMSPEFPWVDFGRSLRNNASSVHIFGNIGLIGFFAGPAAVIVDVLALSDPLLARLPVVNRHAWRIGHFPRAVPPGYPDALKTGSVAGMDQNLARYYERLRLITQGDLWDMERIKTIIAFNLGYYDHFRDAYVNQALKK